MKKSQRRTFHLEILVAAMYVWGFCDSSRAGKAPRVALSTMDLIKFIRSCETCFTYIRTVRGTFPWLINGPVVADGTLFAENNL